MGATNRIDVGLVDPICRLGEISFGEEEQIVLVGKEHLSALLLFEGIRLIAEPINLIAERGAPNMMSAIMEPSSFQSA